MFIEGKITFISPVSEIEIGGEPRQKRTFVVEENSDREFKNSIAIDLRSDKVSLVDNFHEWDNVKVNLTYKAKESTKEPGRYFNSIGAWRIDPIWWSSNTSNDLPF